MIKIVWINFIKKTQKLLFHIMHIKKNHNTGSPIVLLIPIPQDYLIGKD